MITNQAYVFIIFVIVGMIIGILFDFFRVLRKSIKTNDIVTYIEDILFCIMTGIILLYSIFTFNSGEIRIYLFIGLLFGGLIYMLSISKYFVKINVFLLNTILSTIKKVYHIMLIPFQFLDKCMHRLFKPISFIIINLRKNLSKIPFKTPLLKKKQQIHKKMS